MERSKFPKTELITLIFILILLNKSTLSLMGISHAFCSLLNFIFKIIFSIKSFRKTIRVSNRLYPDQGGKKVGPDHCPNCLHKLSADDKKSGLFSVCFFFFKINFFNKIFQAYNQSVKQFVPRSGPTKIWPDQHLLIFLYPLFSLEKKGILISCQSRSVVRPSVCLSVCPSVHAYVRPSRFL